MFTSTHALSKCTLLHDTVCDRVRREMFFLVMTADISVKKTFWVLF